LTDSSSFEREFSFLDDDISNLGKPFEGFLSEKACRPLALCVDQPAEKQIKIRILSGGNMLGWRIIDRRPVAHRWLP
jgi:hypothetical protein